MVEDILAVFGIVGLALALRYVWGLYKMGPSRRNRLARPRGGRSAPVEMHPRWKV
jgi:hypothetical protein